MDEDRSAGRDEAARADEEHDAPGVEGERVYTELVLAGGQTILVGQSAPVSPPPEQTSAPPGDASEADALTEVVSLELAGRGQRDLTQFAGLVHALWRSSFVNHVRWEDALYIALAGADVGMGPTQSLRSINVIEGKPTLSADAIAAICRRSPLCRYLHSVEMTALSSTWATWREGDPEEVRYTFSLDDARRAGLSDGTVHYTGWTTDGESFDSSVARGEPATFGVNQVIPGWTEGLQLMVVGETRRLWIPEDLAYKGRAGYPQGMLVFDVELLSIR